MFAESQNCKANRRPLLGKGSVSVMIAETDTHVMIVGTVSVRSVPRLYEDQRPDLPDCKIRFSAPLAIFRSAHRFEICMWLFICHTFMIT
jgi:hypothetical protein